MWTRERINGERTTTKKEKKQAFEHFLTNKAEQLAYVILWDGRPLVYILISFFVSFRFVQALISVHLQERKTTTRIEWKMEICHKLKSEKVITKRWYLNKEANANKVDVTSDEFSCLLRCFSSFTSICSLFDENMFNWSAFAHPTHVITYKYKFNLNELDSMVWLERERVFKRVFFDGKDETEDVNK